MRRTTAPNDVSFLTLTVVDWADVFTRRLYRDFVVDCLNHCVKNKGLEVFAYVLMTNHLHLVARSLEKPLGNTLRDFKTFTSKELVKMIMNNPQESRKDWMLPLFRKHGSENPLNKYHQLWQNENYPVLLDHLAKVQQKINYIHQNPVRSGFVAEPQDYYYSSAYPSSPVKLCPV